MTAAMPLGLDANSFGVPATMASIVVSITSLAGVLRITPHVYHDRRGSLAELFKTSAYADAGIDETFVQDNWTRSVKGVVRGLHYQRPTESATGQAKLVCCTRGQIWDVVVDLRVASSTFGRSEAFVLSEDSGDQLFIPVGFAHGFCTVSDVADVLYKCATEYDPGAEAGVAWDDPDLAIDWPVPNPILSDRDQHNASFAEYRRRPAF